MRRGIIAAAGLLFVAACSSSPLVAQDSSLEDVIKCAGQVADTKEDRFTGATQIKASSTPGIGMAAFLPYAVWDSSEPSKIAFTVLGGAPQWKYLNCSGLAILADDQRVSVQGSVHGGDVKQGFVIEHVTGSINWADAAPLATVKKFEYRICNDEHQAPQEFLCKIHSLVKQVDAWKRKNAVPKKKG
jgi:hypothetical protein